MRRTEKGPPKQKKRKKAPPEAGANPWNWEARPGKTLVAWCGSVLHMMYVFVKHTCKITLFEPLLKLETSTLS